MQPPSLFAALAAGSWLALQHLIKGDMSPSPPWVTALLVGFSAWLLLRLTGRYRAATAPQLSRNVVGRLAFFSEGYWEAREKFRRAAEAAPGWKLHTFSIVGATYTTDVAVLPGSGDGLVVHLSGVHGVEGYAGSAVQIALISQLAASSQHPGSPTIILVHAVNPYGMAHFRRFNENNVDLNRNALTPHGLQEMLAREPNIAGYFDFELMFNPPSSPTLFEAYVLFPARAVYHILRYGMVHMKRAIVAAQYSNPR